MSRSEKTPRAKTVARWVFAALFLTAGTAHVVHPSFFVSIVPPSLPWPLTLVYISGLAELLLGAALLNPRTRALAAWGLIALLIAVFPANLHMYLHAERYPFPPALLLWRLPLQAVLIAWAYWLRR